MVRPENISSKIDQLKKNLTYLNKYQQLDFSTILHDSEKLGACERFLYLACQSAIDLAEMICKKESLPKPETMSDAFEQLRIAGLIDQELCQVMVQMVGFRNALSHGYEKFNYQIMEDVLKNRLNSFLKLIKAFEKQ